MKSKVWILSIGGAILLMAAIVVFGYTYHTAQMRTFGEGYGLTLTDTESMFRQSGPFLPGRNMRIYKAFYQDSLGKQHLFWFQFGGIDTYIYEEMDGKYFRIKEPPAK